MEDYFRDGWIAQLGALHDVARLIPYPLGSTIPSRIAARLAAGDPTREDLAELAENGREARRLFQALTAPTRQIPVRCPLTRRRGYRSEGARHFATVHDQRLLLSYVGPLPLQPSGWRPVRTLCVDLELLDEEGARGVALDCPTCAETHLFERSDLLQVSAEIRPQKTGSGLLPEGYPHIDSAAFAEIWGSLGPEELSRPEPEVYLLLPPSRDDAYRTHFAGNPAAITPEYGILAGYKQRIINQHGSARLFSVAASSDPAKRISDPPAPRPDTANQPRGHPADN